MKAYVSHNAATWIRERGGALYLWDDDLGDFGRDRIATSDPGGVEFVGSYAGEGVTVYIDTRDPPPEGIRVELRRRPFRGVRVYWDGVRWGRRGTSVGDTGGG